MTDFAVQTLVFEDPWGAFKIFKTDRGRYRLYRQTEQGTYACKGDEIDQQIWNALTFLGPPELPKERDLVDQVMDRLAEIREIAAKRAEEGVMTPEEITPLPGPVPTPDKS